MDCLYNAFLNAKNNEKYSKSITPEQLDKFELKFRELSIEVLDTSDILTEVAHIKNLHAYLKHRDSVVLGVYFAIKATRNKCGNIHTSPDGYAFGVNLIEKKIKIKLANSFFNDTQIVKIKSQHPNNFNSDDEGEFSFDAMKNIGACIFEAMTPHPNELSSLTRNTDYPAGVTELILYEGGKKEVIVNIYERNKTARNICIKHHGVICYVCKFNFEEKYGILGKGYIHIHHEVDIAVKNMKSRVDPINDLKPVCPNCHSMLHTERPSLSVIYLQNLIKNTCHE